jgi:hypothetical protein
LEHNAVSTTNAKAISYHARVWLLNLKKCSVRLVLCSNPGKRHTTT